MDVHQRFHSSLAAYPARKAVFFITAVVVALHLALSLFAWALAQHEIVPVLEQKAYATGLAEARKLTRRLAGGTPIEQLDGVQQQFDATLQRNPDLAYIILTDSAGRILVRSGSGGEVFTPERYSAVTREVERRLVTYGRVHVGIDRQFIVARMKAVRVDIAAILLASLLLSAGLAAYAARQAFAQPVGQVAQVLGRLAAGDYRFRPYRTTQAVERAIDRVLARLNGAYAELVTAITAPAPGPRAQAAYERLRATRQFASNTVSALPAAMDRSSPALVAFLVLLTDSLSRPMLAHYAGDLAAYRAAVGAPWRGGLAIGALYLAAALAMPLAASWRRHVGTRLAATGGCLVLMLGWAGAAMVDDYVVLVVARAVAGMGLALALCALPGHDPVLLASERRSGGTILAMFAMAMLAAECIGAPLGGIIAKHGAVRDVFAVAAALAAASAYAAYALLDDRPAPNQQARPAAARRTLETSMRTAPAAAPASHWRPLLVLSLCARLPAAVAAGAVTPVLLPLALRRSGFDFAEAGRYGLVMAAAALLAAPLFQRLAYRSNRYALFGILGAALMGAGIAPLSDGAASGRSAASALALLVAGQVLMFGTCLVLSQRAVRAAEVRYGALSPWPWSALLACVAAAAGALAAGAGAQAYGPAAAAAASGSLSLMAGAGFMLVALLLRYNQPNLTSGPPR